MATKHYCDICKKEITRNYVEHRFKAEKGIAKVEVTVAIDGTWNKGDICKKCLSDVIISGKEI